MNWNGDRGRERGVLELLEGRGGGILGLLEGAEAVSLSSLRGGEGRGVLLAHRATAAAIPPCQRQVGKVPEKNCILLSILENLPSPPLTLDTYRLTSTSSPPCCRPPISGPSSSSSSSSPVAPPRSRVLMAHPLLATPTPSPHRRLNPHSHTALITIPPPLILRPLTLS